MLYEILDRPGIQRQDAYCTMSLIETIASSSALKQHWALLDPLGYSVDAKGTAM